jgi:cysteine synthase A
MAAACADGWSRGVGRTRRSGHTGILSTIGRTPLVRLHRLFPDARFTFLAKLEAFNPGGSIKDRAALTILQRAMERGTIDHDTVIIESSSGNMGIGLAQACAYLGLRFICVVDPKVTAQNVKILQTYGAEIDLVSAPDPITGEYLPARLERVQRRRREIPNSFWPDQYANPDHASAHHQTIQEILDEVGQLDYLFCSTSTCGTIRGCADFIQSTGLRTRIYAVDSVGSVIFGRPAAKRLIPGHGAAVRPAMFREDMAYTCVHVSDLESVVGCRRLLRSEAILAGGSSGAVVSAVDRTRDVLEPGTTCVAIFPDRGERYLDTVFSDAWVQEQFGSVEHLWAESETAPQWARATS